MLTGECGKLYISWQFSNDNNEDEFSVMVRKLGFTSQRNDVNHITVMGLSHLRLELSI